MTVWMPFQFGVCGRAREASNAFWKSAAQGYFCWKSGDFSTSYRGEWPPPKLVNRRLPSGPVIHLMSSQAASRFLLS